MDDGGGVVEGGAGARRWWWLWVEVERQEKEGKTGEGAYEGFS